MIKCKFRSFDVKEGDCCAVRLIDDTEQLEYNIITDCRCFTSEVEQYIGETFKNNIDLLIITHIDNDHIVGVKQMLENKNLKIGHILYNSYRRKPDIDTKKLNDRQLGFLKEIRDYFPKEMDVIGYRLIDAEKARLLCETILANRDWTRVWNIDYVTLETEPLPLVKDEKYFGRIVFLSPDEESLNEVDKMIKEAFYDAVMIPLEENLNNIEEVYEIMGRLVDINKREPNEENVDSESVKKDADYFRNKGKGKYNIDTNPKNKASIAYIIESGNHKIAMLGDSPWNKVLEGINKWYKEAPKPIVCDVIKISHHGSERSSSKVLFENLISNTYYIPGYIKNSASKDAIIGMISNATGPEGVRKIIFSRSTEVSKELVNLPEGVKADLNINISIDSSEHDIF